MISKTIHYCWFGHNPLPESARKCISSWRKYLPDYEIIEWNEDNFPIDSIPYTSQAYQAGKYAFVSDYARFDIIYRLGGVYFDTDVELIRPIDDIIARGAFMGFEINPSASRPFGAVNPGLGIAAPAGLSLYKAVIDYYRSLNFILPDGSLNITDAVVNITTRELLKAGLKDAPGIQQVADITLYPADRFNPLDDATGRLNITPNTRSIHWYSKTWLHESPLRRKLSRALHRIFGVNAFTSLRLRK